MIAAFFYDPEPDYGQTPGQKPGFPGCQIPTINGPYDENFHIFAFKIGLTINIFTQLPQKSFPSTTINITSHIVESPNGANNETLSD